MAHYKNIGFALCTFLFVLNAYAENTKTLDSLVTILNQTEDKVAQKNILQNYTQQIVVEKDNFLNVSLLGVIPFFIAFGFILFM